ncbi:NERD domain-containing protein [Lysobacter sp. KIS68-7]|uniref:nuclease-related domain-containing protein n=1 Tax=Lysobacter sp. KIS68-7 TaxID=2904252 RepID=UPI001E38EEDE|nr:nuclease-related domain-containing protein [Lysobacter sp. KIS68-7]UHQ20671.1 NERD domain-containing protein [Lysobacter sp. KIS68-7]
MSPSTLLVIASVFVPTALAIAFLWLHRKWQERDGRRSPLEGKAIFGAGEQLRKRIEDHTDNLQSALVLLFWLGPYFLAFFGGAVAYIIRHGTLRRRAREGLKAELFTAQELNRLVASGCSVLHDVPAEGFNLDHVVIGPRAVYMVETKSVRKPAKSTNDSHKLKFDGESLRFPHCVSKAPLEQASRQAQWLRNYLQKTLNTAVPVEPALALPGWWIDITGRNTRENVRVFNPSGRGASFMADERGQRAISTELAGLIAQALLIRYPTGDQK